MPVAITPHTFRRTFITLCFQAGKDLPYVQSQVGHPNGRRRSRSTPSRRGRSIDPRIRSLLEQFLGEPIQHSTGREADRETVL